MDAKEMLVDFVIVLVAVLVANFVQGHLPSGA